jgi:streptogramin lyase
LNAITASGSNYQGLVLAPNGYIYCITTGATSIGYINPATGQFGTFGSATSGGYVSGVLAPNGNIYCVNFFGGPIGIISPGSSPSLSTFSATGPTMAGYYSLSSAVGPDGLIYMPSTGASNVGVYNPTTNMYNTTYLTNIGIITGGYLGAVLGPNGKIYCIPGSATNVGVIDPIARTFTVAGVNVTGSATGYRGGVLAPNGKIYCLPQNNTKVGVIDPVAGTFTDALITNVGSVTKPYMSGTLGPDGNIYCTPEASLPMAVINVNANTISTFGASILTTNGAILAPNGTIYTAPTSSSAINTITFTGLSQLPSSNYCLSAWANKI